MFALLVLVLLMQSVLLVTAPHPTIGSSVLKSSSVPTPGAVVVGMGIAAAGAASLRPKGSDHRKRRIRRLRPNLSCVLL